MFVFGFKFRLEYDDGIMAHKLYGVGDKSTYMSLSQKRAEKSKQSKYFVSMIFRNSSFGLLKLQKRENNRGIGISFPVLIMTSSS